MAGNGKRKIDFFFNPKSIAVIGASPIPGKLSHIIMESLENSGFKGALYPVNPRYKEVMGLKCHPDIRSIGADVDIAVFAVPAPMVRELFKEAGGRIKGAIVVGGGFSETGSEGREIEKKLKEAAGEEGIRVIGPNCMGIYDTVSDVDTLFISKDRIRRPERGRISILSQSGSFALTAMDEFSGLGIGVSRVVSYGNKIDVDEADCLDFLSDDDSTDVIILYIEGIEDGRRFVESAARTSGKKTVMAWKVGKGGAAISAAQSHTGAMAGRYEIYRAAFKKAGIIEISGYEEFMDACRVLTRLDWAKGNRVVIITDGGGLGVSIADACAAAGLDVAPLPDYKKEALRPSFPPYFVVRNPLD
ncbi:MAG: CoA-binding protein, partial [Deltaproteobacteria bacterium]|nr:CoA-binding protein [Deltaproteobacteria bacterium]